MRPNILVCVCCSLIGLNFACAHEPPSNETVVDDALELARRSRRSRGGSTIDGGSGTGSNTSTGDDGGSVYDSGGATTSANTFGPGDLSSNPNCAIPSRPANAVSVLDQGATANDDTNDTAAFQKAIDAAGEGGTVYVPAGRYRMQTDFNPYSGRHAIELKNRQTFWMDPQARLEALPSSYGSYAMIHLGDVSGVTIVGGQLVGDRATHTGQEGEWGMGIRVTGGSDISIRRVSASEFWGDGFYFSKGQTENAKNITVCGVVSDHNRRQGMSVVGASNLLVEDSVFSNTAGTLPEAGIDLEPDPDTAVAAVTMRRCRFSGNRVGVVFTSLSKEVHGPDDSALVDSIVEASREVGIALSSGDRNRAVHNVVRKNASIGILLKWTSPFVVQNNTVEENADNGIHVEASTDWTAGDVTIHQILSNTVRRNAVDGIAAIWSHQNAIRDNVVNDNGCNGIRLNVANDSSVERNSVSGNGTDKTKTCDQIFVDNGTRNRVDGNTCRLGGGAARYGVRLARWNNSANQITNNDLRSSGTVGSLLDQGTGTVLSGNLVDAP